MRGRPVIARARRMAQRLASVAVSVNDHCGTPKRRASSLPTQAAFSVGIIAVMPPRSSIRARTAATTSGGEWPAIAPVSPSEKSTYSCPSMSVSREPRGRDHSDYNGLWQWSVNDLEGFWQSIWDFYGVRSHTPYEQVLASREMPGAQWFTGATLNYAEHSVGLDEDRDQLAIIGQSQTRPRVELTYGELREQVARCRTGLQRLGVGPGDRVAAYLPNIPETIVAFIATASLGAIWSTCAPEFGVRSVVSRFAQTEPKVLFAISGYTYGDKQIDRRDEVAAARAELPTVEHVVEVPYGPASLPDAMTWDQLLAEPGPLAFDPLPFDHPL